MRIHQYEPVDTGYISLGAGLQTPPSALEFGAGLLTPPTARPKVSTKGSPHGNAIRRVLRILAAREDSTAT